MFDQISTSALKAYIAVNKSAPIPMAPITAHVILATLWGTIHSVAQVSV